MGPSNAMTCDGQCTHSSHGCHCVLSGMYYVTCRCDNYMNEDGYKKTKQKKKNQNPRTPSPSYKFQALPENRRVARRRRAASSFGEPRPRTLRTVLIPGGCLLHFPIAPFSLSLALFLSCVTRNALLPSVASHLLHNTFARILLHQLLLLLLLLIIIIIIINKKLFCQSPLLQRVSKCKQIGIRISNDQEFGKNKKPNFAVFVGLA